MNIKKMHTATNVCIFMAFSTVFQALYNCSHKATKIRNFQFTFFFLIYIFHFKNISFCNFKRTVLGDQNFYEMLLEILLDNNLYQFSSFLQFQAYAHIHYIKNMHLFIILFLFWRHFGFEKALIFILWETSYKFIRTFVFPSLNVFNDIVFHFNCALEYCERGFSFMYMYRFSFNNI